MPLSVIQLAQTKPTVPSTIELRGPICKERYKGRVTDKGSVQRKPWQADHGRTPTDDFSNPSMRLWMINLLGEQVFSQ